MKKFCRAVWRRNAARGIAILAICLFTSMSAIAQERILPDAPVPKVAPDTVIDRGPAHSDPYAIRDPYWDTHQVANRHFWLVNAEAWSSTAAPLIGGRHCRHVNGVEPCTAHYGAFYQSWAWASGIEIVAGTAVYHMCRKESHNSLRCDVIQHAVSALNVGWGIHEWQIHRPER